ncbi:hypothetical protein HUG10_08725 [Halorarum halophilum]|uniref:Uncharacterized protein n=1 Tax=Halorarum halophilum TaxID=2743090 RepID=A0A7D5KW33_9EURY|nr:hypothetical protein [Halobaculum halophilum]QLG26018.1 hypothetical protein HUG10_08725 [Halobaculum halophilum]
MSRKVADADEVDDDGAHLEDVPSGAGCTEIWEKLSEQREADREEASDGRAGAKRHTSSEAAAAEADDAGAE